MKLIVCETMAAIVLHLREEDGTLKLGGGLDLTKLLCNDGGLLAAWNGWDTKIPAPDSAEAARQVTQRPRYCIRCIEAWEAKE